MRFRLNTLKSTASATDVNLLKTNNLRGTKSAFLTPEMYHEHPHPVLLIWETQRSFPLPSLNLSRNHELHQPLHLTLKLVSVDHLKRTCQE